MERYYKVEKTSPTGVKIKDIEDRIILIKKDINDLREKYGFEDTYNSGWDVIGIVAVTFDKQPDLKFWKKVPDTEGYYPKVCYKKAYNDFNKIKSISRHEIDSIIGIKEVIHQCGFYLEPEDVYLFVISDTWGVVVPDDLIEISNIEYMKYTGKE